MRFGMGVTAHDVFWTWLCERAAWLWTRFGRSAGGQSPYEDASDRPYRRDVARFGETVQFCIPHPHYRHLAKNSTLHKR